MDEENLLSENTSSQKANEVLKLQRTSKGKSLVKPSVFFQI